MATLKFILKQPYKPGGKRVLNQTETRIYAVLIVDRDHMVKVKTEHTIFPGKWDFKKQRRKYTLAGSIEFNRRLDELKKQLEDLYAALIKNTPDMPFIQVAEIMKEAGKNAENPFVRERLTFFDYFDEFLASIAGELTSGTIKKFRTLQTSLQTFTAENKKYKHLTFSQIDHAFKNSYLKYLRSLSPRGRMKRRPEGQQDGLLIDTQRKYIESLKTFLRWAELMKYNPYKMYEEFEAVTEADRKRRKKARDIVALTVDELRQLSEHDFSGQLALDRVRDVFCFGCYTGQRWSDIERFEKSQLEGDVWTFSAYKTKKDTEIDLTGYAAPALDILKKYDYRLPVISLQKFNDYLKEAGRVAGIDKSTTITRYVGTEEITMTHAKYEFLSSHTARKTCVSILLNDYNMPVTHVLEITGHSELKTLQKYIATNRQARREAMSKTAPVNAPLKVVKRAG